MRAALVNELSLSFSSSSSSFSSSSDDDENDDDDDDQLDDDLENFNYVRLKVLFNVFELL